jgi:hypothetical protein
VEAEARAAGPTPARALGERDEDVNLEGAGGLERDRGRLPLLFETLRHREQGPVKGLPEVLRGGPNVIAPDGSQRRRLG